MQPSKEQIEFAARLVPDEVFTDDDGTVRVGDSDPDCVRYREWQPWANTEAGRSDWAVLFAAVMPWVANLQKSGKDIPESTQVRFLNAMPSGNLIELQEATVEIAAAIGEQMGVEGV